MYRFSFVLASMEAQNLLDILTSEVRDQRFEAAMTDDPKIKRWCNEHADYIEQKIIKPMKEGIVEEK